MDMDLVVNIDVLKQENIKMNQEIENLKKKIEDNIVLIQQHCEHNYTKYYTYGEKPTRQCNICGVYA